MADQLSADLLAADGSQTGEIDLDPQIFGVEPNVPVMHEVVTAQLAAARSGTHSTKTRSEVRGGGRKPWRQKGLGRARHGSIRSPQWVGGGVAHGPKPRDYSMRINKRVKRLALTSALSTRAGAGAIKVVDGFDWPEPRTKTAVGFLDKAGLGGKVLVVLVPGDTVPARSFRNLQEARVITVGQINTYDVLWADSVLFTTDSLGGMSGNEAYDVSDADFVREDDSAPSPVTSNQDAGAESIAADDTVAAGDTDATGGDES